MNPVTLLLLLVLALFGALTTLAVYENGYLGIFEYHLPSSAGWQVFVDLVIALVLAMIWMVRDAQRQGRTAWPYLALTLAAGSFGPLVYLLVGQLRSPRAALA